MDKTFRNNLSLGEVNMLHIFIVSLQQDVEKRETISKTLKDFGLKFSFVDAIYGKDLPDSTLNSFRKKSTGKIVDRGFPATPGEIGCTLSHLKAYQKVIDRGLDWACILEDDAILDERFEMFIKQFQSTNLDSHNLYLLGGQTPNSKRLIMKSIKNIRNIGSQKFHKTIKSEKIIYRTCCYLISSDLAKSLISLGKNKLILADDWAYLIEKGLIRNIYLAEFVEHPIDLVDSNIQREREIAAMDIRIKTPTLSLSKRVKTSIKYRLKRVAFQLYKYIEPISK